LLDREYLKQLLKTPTNPERMYLGKMEVNKGSKTGNNQKNQGKSGNRKREIIKEIEDLKSRHGDYYPYPLLSNWQVAVNRVSQLQASFDLVKAQSNSSDLVELVKYVPVGLIATLESFFTGVIRQLIDFSPTYLERISRLKDYIKFDAEYMIAIPQKRVSVGEFVSHQLKINNLNNILAHMNALLENDPPKNTNDDASDDYREKGFWKTLKGVTSRETGELILKNPDKSFQDIEEMFKLRHKIAHEIDFYIPRKLDDIEEGLKSILDFINATGEFVARRMSLPVTLKEKLDYSRDKLQSLQAELAALTEKVRERMRARGDKDSFEYENKAWQNFSNAHIGFAGWLRGGTGGVSVDGENGNDLARRDVEIELIQDRIKTLKRWLGV
jgi:hypothetical protein